MGRGFRISDALITKNTLLFAFIGRRFPLQLSVYEHVFLAPADYFDREYV